MRVAQWTAILISASLLFHQGSSSWLSSRIFPVSDTRPISEALTKSASGKVALEGLLEYYRAVEWRMKRSDPEDALRENLIPQLLPFNGWPALSQRKQRMYLPYRQNSASSDARVLKYEEEKFKRELRSFRRDERRFFENVIAFNTAVERTGGMVNESTVLHWPRYLHNALINFESSTRSDFCRMYANVAYRINGTWGIDATLTNDFREVFRADRQRRYVYETVYMDQKTGTVQAIAKWMNLSAANDTLQFWNGVGAIDRMARTRVSTVVSLWGGRPGVSHFDAKQFEDNPAFTSHLKAASISAGKGATRRRQQTLPFFFSRWS